MIGQPLRYLGETSSTNDDAMRWAREGAAHGSVVRADSQTRGRGRLGRDWSSPANLGLYFSVVLRPENLPLESVSQLTMIAALACTHAIEEVSGLRASVKWPNDVVLHGRKIGGILSEATLRNEATEPGQSSSTRINVVDFAVVGIGLNVDFQASDLPQNAKIPATSLRLESGDIGVGEKLFQAFLDSFEKLYTRFDNGDWPLLRDEFVRRDILQGESVRVEMAHETYRGVASGISDNGILKVRTQEAEREVIAGDVLLER